MKNFVYEISHLAILLTVLNVHGAPVETVIEGVVIIADRHQTMRGCMDERNCCNDVSGTMFFIAGNDSLTLYQHDYAYPERFNCRLEADSVYYCDSLYFLSPKGAYSCRTGVCEELHCGPFYHNRRYRLTGYCITDLHVRNEINVKYFKVNKSELLGDGK